MCKMVRDFGIIVAFGIILLFTSNSAVDLWSMITILGSAGLFAIVSEVVRCVNEIDLKTRNYTKEEFERAKNIRLVVRDSLLMYGVVYGFMTTSFGLVTFELALPYMIAALAPTMIVTAISKELRIPSTNMLIVGKKSSEEKTKKYA